MTVTSAKERLSGCSWLLTGATGFLGSVLIEQMLRNCNPSKIILIILPKKGVAPMTQVAKLLSRPLYNTVRAQYGSTEALLAKFEAVDQDLCEASELHFPTVDIVVHCAASISFHNHIHEAISANYRATQLVSEAALRIPNLKAFVHVSTCYVNGNLPRGSQVPEVLPPILHEGKPVDYQALVNEIMSLPHDEAEERAVYYRKLWNFPNNYAFTKRLAEHLLLDRNKAGLSVRIVRPSIVGGTSLHHICPGYIGNAAGTTAFAIGIAFGMWTCTEFGPDNVSDVVPCDLVTNTILMAAAAQLPKDAEPLIMQSATSGMVPMSNKQFYAAVARKCRTQPAPFHVFSGFPKPTMQDIYCTSHEKYVRTLRRCSTSVKARTFGMRLAGHKAAATALSTRWKVFKLVSDKVMDFELYFGSDNVKALWNALPEEEKEAFRCVWEQEDSWDAYLDTYMDQVWERYVRPLAPKPKRPAPKRARSSVLCCMGPDGVRVKE